MCMNNILLVENYNISQQEVLENNEEKEAFIMQYHNHEDDYERLIIENKLLKKVLL